MSVLYVLRCPVLRSFSQDVNGIIQAPPRVVKAFAGDFQPLSDALTAAPSLANSPYRSLATRDAPPQGYPKQQQAQVDSEHTNRIEPVEERTAGNGEVYTQVMSERPGGITECNDGDPKKSEANGQGNDGPESTEPEASGWRERRAHSESYPKKHDRQEPRCFYTSLTRRCRVRHGYDWKVSYIYLGFHIAQARPEAGPKAGPIKQPLNTTERQLQQDVEANS